MQAKQLHGDSLRPSIRTRFLAMGMFGFLLTAQTCLLDAQEKAEPTESVDAAATGSENDSRVGYLVQVPLPINSANAASVRQTLERLVEKAPTVIRPEDRPVIVLEFDTANGKTGRGSKLESCLELARYLTSPDMSRVRTIAYVPAARTYSDENLAIKKKPTSQLNGHAVMVAIAANDIAMHQDAAIGLAGADEKNRDQIVLDMYRNIAGVRLTLPMPLVMSMIDPRQRLYRVSTNSGVVYVDAKELDKLELAGDVIESNTISAGDSMALFTSKQLHDYRLIRHRVNSRNDLARALQVSPSSLEGDPKLGQDWDAVQFEFPDYIDRRTVEWVVRALNGRSSNLIVFRMNSSGGDPDACLRLASQIAEYDSNKVRTVAFVTGVARGPAAMVALSCDHLIMSPAAEIGGMPDPPVDPEWITDTQDNVTDLARTKGRDWSIFRAVVDPEFKVTRYRERNSGQVRLLSSEEHESLKDPDSWVPLGPLGVGEGIDANTAEQLFLARAISKDMESLQTFYQLETQPKTLTPTVTDRWLEKIAHFLASPMVAPWLLFGAVFFLSTEMSAPGIGVPGFIGTICLIAFFWSQHLDGNAHWLEIILFMVGVVFIAMELFILPGFGIFGVGGLLMVIVSIVLASQTFIIPRTSEELNRLPISLSMVLAGAMGFFVAIAILRKVLPNTPYLRRMMLEPPKPHDESGLADDGDPSAVVDWSYLQGRNGQAITRLVPSGKARIDGKVYDVISDGRMIEKGQSIDVVQAIGNRIVVKPAERG